MAAVLSESCGYEALGPASQERGGAGLRPIALRTLHSPLPSQLSVPPSPASYGQCAPSEDSDVRLDLFSETLQRLSREVRRHEDQQLAQQRHMVRLESTLQGLQEDQEVRTSRAPMDGCFDSLSARLQAIERSQAALAAGAQRALRLALKTAEAQKSLSERQDETQGRCVHEAAQNTTRLQALERGMASVEALERGMASVEERLAKTTAGTELTGFGNRLAHNEAAQKRLEQRMKQFEAEELEGRFAKLETLTKELQTRLKESPSAAQEEAKQAEDAQSRLAKLEASLSEQGRQLRICQGIAAESARQLKDLDTAMAELQSTAAAEALFGDASAAGEESAKSEQGSAVEALTSQLARLEEQIGAARLPEIRRELEELRSSLKTPEPEAEAPIVEGVKVEPAAKAISELRARLEDLAEIVDERNLSQTRQVASLVPELKAQVERFGKQCVQCTAKTEAFEVRLDLTRTNVDTQEQRLQALSERVEKGLARSHLALPSSGGASCAVPGEKPGLFQKPKQVHFAAASADLLPTLLPKEPFFSLQSAKVSQKLDELCAKLPPKVTSVEPPAKNQDDDKLQVPSGAEASAAQDAPSDGDAAEKTPPVSPVRRSISDFTGC